MRGRANRCVEERYALESLSGLRQVTFSYSASLGAEGVGMFGRQEPGTPLHDLPAGKYLMVASTGGHLAQLVLLADRMSLDDDSLWVTFESEQSRSLLEGRRVLYVPYVAPRDWKGIARTMKRVTPTLHGESFDLAISTGSGVALGVLPLARLHGIPTRYIESVSRSDGPSVTGRIIHAVRAAETFTQHDSWAGGRWLPERPVLARYERVPRRIDVPARLKVFVTLGTIRPYRFDALVDALIAAAPDADFLWQVGETGRASLPGTSLDYLNADEFRAAASESDAVVTHAGVGTILTLLDSGLSPVVVPRRQHRGEHVDDHQLQIFNLLRRLNVGVPVEVDDLSAAHLSIAATTKTQVGASRV